MTFQIPIELDSAIRAAVQGGRFASVDEAMTIAARLLVDQLQTLPENAAPEVKEVPDLFTGSMRDHADEIDEIVVEIYRQRRADTWRDIDVE